MGIVRTLLALAVVSAHYHAALPLLGDVPFYGHGAYSVSAFFIASGFYMSLVINEKYGDRWKQFYISRLLRLGPILLSVLAAHAVLFLISGTVTMYGGFTIPAFWAMFQKVPWIWKLVVVSANTTTVGTDALNFVAFDPNGQAHLQKMSLAAGQVPGSWFAMFQPGWSLSVEIVFYLLAPFIVRRGIGLIGFMLAASLTVRAIIGVSSLAGSYVWEYA